ncbi:MAG: family 14 glycosylhydrolase [Saccharospirillum sp.]|nr:family 14 glycosylhydrolase [Saccharospirillum sp.]
MTLFSKAKALSAALLLAVAAPVWADLAQTTNAMAPLELTDSNQWNAFQWQLQEAESYGLDGISVDVWWGKVEAAGDNQFDWSYYDAIFDTIINAGLKIVPIMSFHQCGGNVGDDCNIPIPGWFWSQAANQNAGISESDLRYKSELGNYSWETVSLWADDYVLDQYVEFMQAFQARYAHLADHIIELNISMGPAGELRYPSYNQHDDNGGPNSWLAQYPNRGTLQGYGRLAVEDFRDWAQGKYGTLSALNNAWGTSLGGWTQINPPSNASFFFDNQDHLNTQYGRDFIRWYHESLTEHGTRMIDAALQGFDGALSDIELGMKIPGIHWQIGNPNNGVRRVPEITAGLIPTDIAFDSPATGHGYNSMIGTTQTGSDPSRNVVLHFTALEMNNQDWDGGSLAYSRAQDLVFWVGDAAGALGVDLKGENALAGGVQTDTGWDNIENAFTWTSYNGLTVLRLSNVTENSTGRNRYAQFIQNFKAPSGSGNASVAFTCNNGSTYWGQSVYVVGNIPELGNWSPANGVLLNATNYPTWQGTVGSLPENTQVEWKCVKRDDNDSNAGVDWQGGANNQVTTGGSGSTGSSTGSF